MHKIIKLDLPKEFNNNKFKTTIKRISIAVAAACIAVGSYKFGKNVGIAECDYSLGRFLNDHPDVKEPFVKAYQELCNGTKVIKNK
jgi:hypothetical protein